MAEHSGGELSDFGILVLRVGIGAILVFVHGLPDMRAGTEEWGEVGKAMQFVGISFWPTFWGFVAAFAQFFGGICMVFGVIFRPLCFLIALRMAVVVAICLSSGGGIAKAGRPLELGIVAPGQIDCAHSPAPQKPNQPVAADPPPGHVARIGFLHRGNSGAFGEVGEVGDRRVR